MFSKKNVFFQNNKVNVVTFIFKLFLRIVVVYEFVFKAHSLESLKTFSSFYLRTVVIRGFVGDRPNEPPCPDEPIRHLRPSFYFMDKKR